MKQKRDMIEQDGVSFEAYACPKCGEELLTMPQLNALAEKYRKLRAAKEVTFAKCGNSIALRLPSDIAHEYKISPGKDGLLARDKGSIRIIPKG